MKKFFLNIWKAHRKLWCIKIIPLIIFNKWRIFLYRSIGFKNISKKCFIGMRCYLDDMEPKMLYIEDGATISCGVFFTCHGKNQHHYPIIVKKGAYIGMRASVIGRNGSTIIGENSIVGACSLVNKNIPNGETWVGIPVRKIKKHNL